MRLPTTACPTFALLALAACATRPQANGPMPVRNQHPAQLTVLHLDPTPVPGLPQGAVAGRLTTAYTSLFLFGDGNGNEIELDGELLRTSLQLRAGVAPGLEFGVELPFVHASGGFLDDFLIDYHDALAFPDQGRTEAPRDDFVVRASQGGEAVYQLEPHGVHLGDLPLSLRYTLVEPAAEHPGVALALGVELPTGDASAGFGNGEVDVAFGAAAQWPVGFGSVFGHAQYTIAGSPTRARAVGFQFADVSSAGVGAELPVADGLAAVVQFEWETSTLRDLGFARVGRDQLMLWLGGRLRLAGDLYLEAALGEDLRGYVSPDVTAFLAMAWLPGGSR